MHFPHNSNNGRPRSRLENPPRRCRASRLPAFMRSRIARPDFEEPTVQAGFTILRGKTRHSAPCRSRRSIPIPPTPKLGASAIRRCGDSTHGWQDATEFHKFVWIVGNASRKGIKKARDAITFQTEGIRKPNQEMHRALASPARRQDITRTGNIYTSD